MLNKWMRPLGFAMMLSGCQTSTLTPQVIPPHTAPVAVCGAGEMMMQTTLWFDLPSSAGAAGWSQFAERDITPHFPSPLTIYDGRSPQGNRKVLVLLHPADRASSESINALRDKFKHRFATQPVTRIDSLVCAAL